MAVDEKRIYQPVYIPGNFESSVIGSDSDFSINKLHWSGKFEIERNGNVLFNLTDYGKFDLGEDGIKVESSTSNNDLVITSSSEGFLVVTLNILSTQQLDISEGTLLLDFVNERYSN